MPSMNKSQFGFVCSGMGWGGWGIAYSLVSKSLPTRWEEPFPSPADPHKIHLSSILSLSSAQPFPQICSTRSGFSTLHQELNAVLEKSTSQVRGRSVSLELINIFENGLLTRLSCRPCRIKRDFSC